MNSPTHLRMIAVASLFAILLSACGSPAAVATQAPEPTQAPAATHTHAPAATNAPTQESAPPEQPEVLSGQVEISLANFAFTPKEITITVGTTVTWRNADFAPHTVTADDGSFGSNTLGDGDSFTFTFSTAGTFDYHCEFHGGTGHSGMSGTITVVEE